MGGRLLYDGEVCCLSMEARRATFDEICIKAMPSSILRSVMV